MNRKNIIVLFILSFNSIFAQQLISYGDNIEQADEYLEFKDYSKASEYYKKAFKIVNENVISSDEHFDAAIAFSLSNDKKSTYKQLSKISKKGVFDVYTNYENIIDEEGFESLHNEKKWKKIVEQLKKKQEIADDKINEDLIQTLGELYNKDQKVREDFIKIHQEYGENSDEYKNYSLKMNEVDSLNFIEFEKIIEKYGWLGPETIGEEGVNILFLLVQHNNLEREKKYLPLIKKAVKKGRENPVHLAYLEDRIAMFSNEMQSYGTQMKSDNNNQFYLWPIKNPKDVNKRRLKIGLDTLETYLERSGIVWNVENHKENTKKIFEKAKK